MAGRTAEAVAVVVDLVIVAGARIAAEVDTVPSSCVGAAMVEVGMVLNSLLASFPSLLPVHLNR